MATRFYLPSTSAAPPISPVGSGWDTTADGFVRRKMDTVKTSTAMTTHSHTDADDTDNNCWFRQYISHRVLAAQTIDIQTIKFQLRGRNPTSLNDQHLAWGLRVIGPDLTERGTILATGRDDIQLAEGTITNRSFPRTSSAVTALRGDYLVLEVGVGGNPAAGGHDTDLSFGDDNASDLPEDNSTTTALNPWMEFANDIVFAGPTAQTLGQRIRRALG